MTREEAINFLLGVGGKNLEPGSAVALEIAQLLKDSIPVAASPALEATGTDNGIYEGTGSGFKFGATRRVKR